MGSWQLDDQLMLRCFKASQSKSNQSIHPSIHQSIISQIALSEFRQCRLSRPRIHTFWDSISISTLNTLFPTSPFILPLSRRLLSSLLYSHHTFSAQTHSSFPSLSISARTASYSWRIYQLWFSFLSHFAFGPALVPFAHPSHLRTLTLFRSK